MDKYLEELAKAAPKCMKKRPVGRPVVKKKYYNNILTQEVKSWQNS